MTSPPATAPILSQRAGLVVLGLAFVTVAICWLIPPANTGDEVGVNMDLPTEIGGLEGVPIPVSQAEKEILPPDTEFAGNAYGDFRLPESDWLDRIVCKIVLSGREKRSIHRPERCLTGQGWTQVDSQIIDVPLQSGRTLKVTSLLVTRPIDLRDGTTRQLKFCYLYWYVGRKVTTPYSFVRVLLTNWDLIVHRSNQRWAYLICAAYATDNLAPGGRTQEQTVDELKKFIALAAPSMMKSEAPGNTTAAAGP
jgi:hypothetical protein